MSKKNLILISLAIVLIGIISRLLPHPWNTTPITAIAIFSSAYLGWRYSLGILLTTMLVSDVFTGFYEWQIMFAVYGSFVLACLIGLFLRKKRTMSRVFASALGSSVLFFLVTNWAVWQFGTMYEHSLSGLFQSYFMALPFFRNSLLGDLFYSGLFFGAFETFKAKKFKEFKVVNKLGLFFYARKKYDKIVN